MADNYLITGYWGQPHVTSENDRGIHAGIFGAGRNVLPVGKQFKADYIGNNIIRMYDGKLIDNGAAAGIPAGEYVDFVISNAGQGMNRNDLIVFQYSIDASTLIERGEFIVVKGVETNGTASDPAITQADLLTGNATLEQFPLWRVSVSGVAISAPVKLFAVSKTIPDKADSGHSHALTSGNITGVLPVTKGGTGANSVSKARKALGLGETEGALPVANGGTGATTAAAARSNLGITPENIGALPKSGGTVNGNITVDDGKAIIAKRTIDGSEYTLEFNVTTAGAGYIRLAKDGVSVDYISMNDARTYFDRPANIPSGGTGADNAAKARENLGITPENIGALPLIGGKLTGDLVIHPTTDTWKGFSAQRTFGDGKKYMAELGVSATRAASVYLYDADDTSTNINFMQLGAENTIFKKPVTVASGGTGATTAAQALQNLGIIYSAEEPTYQAGAIWLKPVE